MEATIVKAKSPRPLIKGSMASASLVSNIIVDKYDKATSLYRQEVSFQRLGINLNCQNM
jgi:Transposase IS66 family.